MRNLDQLFTIQREASHRILRALSQIPHAFVAEIRTFPSDRTASLIINLDSLWAGLVSSDTSAEIQAEGEAAENAGDAVLIEILRVVDWRLQSCTGCLDWW